MITDAFNPALGEGEGGSGGGGGGGGGGGREYTLILDREFRILKDRRECVVFILRSVSRSLCERFPLHSIKDQERPAARFASNAQFARTFVIRPPRLPR